MKAPQRIGGARALRAVVRAVRKGDDCSGFPPSLQPLLPLPATSGSSGRATPSLVSAPSCPPSPCSSCASCSPLHSAASAMSGWESEGEGEVESGGFWYPEWFVFGSPLSKEEFAEAVSTIQQVFVPISSSSAVEDASSSTLVTDHAGKTSTLDDTMSESSAGSQADWVEPTMHLQISKSVQSQGRNKLVDAFRSLQSNPSIQRMVVSLSSDKVVWDAVMKNRAVKELKESFNTDKDNGTGGRSDTKILSWILISTKKKIAEYVEKIAKLLNHILHPYNKGKVDAVEDAMRSSFILSVIVFVVVIVYSVHRS